jgi:PAS domain-containing protein
MWRGASVADGGSLPGAHPAQAGSGSVAVVGADLREALDAAGMAAWEWDLATGRVACANAPAVWGRGAGTADEFMAAIHPEDRARVRAARAQALAHPERTYACEFRVLGPGGGVRWLESRGRVVAGPDGRPRRVVGVSVDVTARRLAEEAAREGSCATGRCSRARTTPSS